MVPILDHVKYQSRDDFDEEKDFAEYNKIIISAMFEEFKQKVKRLSVSKKVQRPVIFVRSVRDM